MSEWRPYHAAFPDPDAIHESRTYRAPDQTWDVVRVGDQAWLRCDDFAVLPLDGLKSLGELFDEPELAADGTTHVVAAPPMLYLASGQGRLGIENMTAGPYEVTWFDLDESQMLTAEATIDGGDETFAPPGARTGRLLLFLRRTSR